MRILISDDSLTQRVMLESVTRRWGFTPELAEDGQQALEILSGPDAPRLVLLDWEMPKLDGPEVCRLLRAEENQDPPYILLLTSRQKTRDIVAGLGAGANDYIAKPFENTELLARLQVGARMLDLQRELTDTREALEFQANHDALTGLLNRGAAMQAMARQMKQTSCEQASLQIGLFDIDHFKSINDNHGHLVGDAVLSDVAKRIENTLGPEDCVGRYGGEEFLLLVNSADRQADSLFERLRCAVGNKAFVYDQLSLEVTISGGITAYNSRLQSSAKDLLASADIALYQAKSSGRNCIVFNDIPVPTIAASAIAQA